MKNNNRLKNLTRKERKKVKKAKEPRRQKKKYQESKLLHLYFKLFRKKTLRHDKSF